MNRNYARSEYSFTTFRKTKGYVNVLLDGIWARAPYLHNGSVPSLRKPAPAGFPAVRASSIAAATCTIPRMSASNRGEYDPTCRCNLAAGWLASRNGP